MSNDPLQDLRDADLDDLLERAAFRRFLWDMLADVGFMGSNFTGDAQSTAFREGRRDLANQIIGKCQARRADALILVLREAETLAPLIQGQEAPDDRASHLYRDDDD